MRSRDRTAGARKRPLGVPEDSHWQNFDRQLFANQLWELVAFLAKAAFFFLLTPIMVRAWGESGYGVFAVAGSAFIFLGLLDFGVRPRVRVELSRADREGRLEKFRPIVVAGIIAQMQILFPAIIFVGGLAAAGVWRRWLHLAAGGNWIIALTTVCAASYLISALFLEPLIARGSLGKAKKAGALAALASLPVVWLLLRWQCSVAVVLLAWFGCLIAGNLSSLFLAREEWPLSAKTPIAHGSFRLGWWAGFYFSASTLSWLLKTHLLTLVVASIGGPVEAGLFFVFLRLSEIVSNFGAMSSDAATSGLAQARGAGERRRRFARVVGYALFFSLQAALAIAILAPPFVEMWWHAMPILSHGMGIFVGLFGLSMGLNRVISCAAFGLGLEQSVALWGMLDGTLGIFAALVLYPHMGLNGILLGSSLGSLCLLPLVRRTLREISVKSLLAVGREARLIGPWIGTSMLFLFMGRWSGSIVVLASSALLVAGLSLIWLRQRFRRGAVADRQTFPLGQRARV